MAIATRYRPTEPVGTCHQPTSIPGPTLSAIIGPNGELLFDAWSAVKTLGPDWNNQQRRMRRLAVEPVYLYRQPGQSMFRTFLTLDTLRRWFQALERTRGSAGVSDETCRVLTAISDAAWGVTTPPLTAATPDDATLARVSETDVPAGPVTYHSGATVSEMNVRVGPATDHSGTEIITTDVSAGCVTHHSGATVCASAPGDTTSLVIAVHELTTAIVTDRAERTAMMELLRHMSAAVADHQADIVQIRVDHQAAIQTLREHLAAELTQLREWADTQGKLLGYASDTAFQAARQNEMIIGWTNPPPIPAVSFDQACAFLNVLLPYAERRMHSHRLAVWGGRVGSPASKRKGRHRNASTGFVRDAVRHDLERHGLARPCTSADRPASPHGPSAIKPSGRGPAPGLESFDFRLSHHHRLRPGDGDLRRLLPPAPGAAAAPPTERREA
ncbi:MAG TPA: hypothetical protein VD866_06875 [Urbifossiella sp.]|nr:hypothetical protein [Urbifossiella sp.]